MMVVHISIGGGGSGGERGAYRLHCGLRFLDQDSSMLMGSRHTDDPHATEIVRSLRLTDQVQTALRQAILRGLDDRTLRPEFAANSRRIAVEEYGLMTMRPSLSGTL